MQLKKVAVLSGKGGVGKTTVSLYMARQLAQSHRVALVDLDITMENIRDAVEGEIDALRDEIIPICEGNLEIVYYEASEKSQITWVNKDYGDAAVQLIERTRWNSPEYMILDLPPGNDIITLTALPLVDCVIVVYQSHPFSVSNAQRIIELCRDMRIPVAGAIKNFSYLICPDCGKRIDIFNEPTSVEIPVIAEIPFCNPISHIETFFDTEKILYAVNNPIKLKPRSRLKAKLLRMVLQRGMEE